MVATPKVISHIGALPGVFSQNRLDVGTAVLLPLSDHRSLLEKLQTLAVVQV